MTNVHDNKIDFFAIAFFLIILPVSLFFLLQYNHTILFSITANEYIPMLGAGDSSYQLKAAVDYLKDGILTDWVLNLWPPGWPGFYALVIKILGEEYFPLKVLILALESMGFAFYVLYRKLKNTGLSIPKALVVSMLPLTVLSFWNVFLLFFRYGASGTDFFSFLLLIILVVNIVDFCDRRKLKSLVYIAFILAALAYLRSYYFSFIKFATLIYLFSAFVWAVFQFLKRRTIFFHNNKYHPILLVIFLTWLLLLPWKIYLVMNDKPFDWTATDQAWAAQWRNDLPIFLAGANTPCVIEEDLCQKLMPFQTSDTWAEPVLGSRFYKNLTLLTFITRPFEWYSEKAKLFYIFWFDGDIFDSVWSGSSEDNRDNKVFLIEYAKPLGWEMPLWRKGFPPFLMGINGKFHVSETWTELTLHDSNTLRSIWLSYHAVQEGHGPFYKKVQYIQSVILLFAVIILVFTALYRAINNISAGRKFYYLNIPYLLFFLFFMHNLMVFTFVHFEPRYAIPLKIVALMLLILQYKDLSTLLKTMIEKVKIYSHNSAGFQYMAKR